MSGIVRIDPALVATQPQEREGEALARTASLFVPGAGLSAGVWEAEPFTEYTEAYPCDEMCVLIEGHVTLEAADGSSQTFGPGDSFAIEQGTECTWIQPDRVRKFYVIRER